jgi:hypothetical protein
VIYYYIRKLNLVSHTEGERRLRAFENRVLRRVIGPMGDEVTGEWKKLYSEINDLYGVGLTTPHSKKPSVMKHRHDASSGDKTIRR